MALISAIITEMRTEINDDDATRFSDTQILNILKRTIRRANRIAQRNGLQFAKKKATLTTVADQAYVALSGVSDFDVPIGLWRDDLDIKLKMLTEDEWKENINAPALKYYRIDYVNSRIDLLGTPTSEQTLTLWYYPVVDPSSYTVNSSTPWAGRLDDIIMEYAGIRLKNIDEMDVTMEQQLLSDMETQIVFAYGPNSPQQVEGKGWL